MSFATGHLADNQDFRLRVELNNWPWPERQRMGAEGAGPHVIYQG
jgi:hypothetical protein